MALSRHAKVFLHARSDDVTPSFWGMYDRVVCVGSLSKAFGLPGLRLGWLCAPPELLEQARALLGSPHLLPVADE